MNESELLLTEILNCDRLSLYQKKETILDKDVALGLSLILKRRISGEPLAYILGKIEFMGLEFKVNQDVLIPRPETEILVESAIKQFTVSATRHGGSATFCGGHSSQSRVVNILEIGTGSGCIAVSLAKLLPDALVTATDISSNALKIAEENALLNKVAERIRFIPSDLFSNYVLRTINYELIISNPPYIISQEINGLSPEVLHEPRLALDGGQDGLDFYRRIIKEAPLYLKKYGLLIMEMGFGQRQPIEKIFQDSGKFEIIEVVKDYSSIERIIIAQIKS